MMRSVNSSPRQRVPAALWSELLALWRDGARRPALPLLLALLLFVVAPFAARANCCPEMSGHPHPSAENHRAGETQTHDHHAASQVGARLQAPAMCCSCSDTPLKATVATLPAPHHCKADSHALVFTFADASPVYRFDALEGLDARAGPSQSKPQRLCLASLIGRAPPAFL